MNTTRNGRGSAQEGGGLRSVPSGADRSASDPLTPQERHVVDVARRGEGYSVPTSLWLGMVERLTGELAERDRTIDQLRASNRRLARRSS